MTPFLRQDGPKNELDRNFEGVRKKIIFAKRRRIKFYYRKKIFRGEKINFRSFFRTLKLKKSIFKGFMKNHDFRPETMTFC